MPEASQNPAASRGRLAQLSAEAMLVLLIFVALVGISYFAVSRIGTGAEQSIQLSLAKSSFSEILSKAQEACFLGNGNIRTAKAKGAPLRLSSQGRNLSASSAGGFYAEGEVGCEVSVKNAGQSSAFTIANNGGVIEISGS